MKRWSGPGKVLALLLCGLLSGSARADVTGADRELVNKVSTRLLAVTEALPGYLWPPVFEIQDDDKVNAWATARTEGEGDGARLRPRIFIYRGMLDKVVQGNADRLAYILGHELGHVVLRHITRHP
jgi:Zn-dependent protease with chaperone function